MDYHGSKEKYFEAKKNIINFQNKSDVFVYNKNDKMLCEWARSSAGLAVPAANTIPLADKEIPLPGEHNKENIKLKSHIYK